MKTQTKRFGKYSISKILYGKRENPENIQYWKMLLYAMAIFACMLLGYAVSSFFLIVAFGLIVWKILFPSDEGEEVLPFVLVVTWGAEIWSGLNVRLYTMIKLLLIARILIRWNKKFSIKWFYCFLAAFSVYMLVGNILYGQIDIMILINLVLSYFCIYRITEVRSVPLYKRMATMFAFGVVLSQGIATLSKWIPTLHEIVISILQTNNDYNQILTRITALTYDPNLFGFYVLTAFATLAYWLLYVKEEHLYVKISIGVVMLILAALGIATISKTFILAFAVAVILIVAFYPYKRVKFTKKHWSILAVIVGGVLCISLALLPVLMPYIKAIFERLFNNANLNEFTTGRADLWKYYIDLMLHNPLTLVFGVSVSSVIPDFSSPHNMVLYMLYHFGIVGFTVYVCMIISLIHTKLKFSLDTIRKYLPAFIYFVYIMSIDTFVLYDVKIAMLALVFLPIKMTKKEDIHDVA